MLTKVVILVFVAVLGIANAGVIAPFASSYNAHTINHAVAHPVLAPAAAASLVAAAPAAPLVASNPYVSPGFTRAAYTANPYPYSLNPYAAYSAYAGYSGLPYSPYYF